MRRHTSLGIAFPPVLLLAGAYLLYASITRTQWYIEVYLVAGAMISAIGLLAVAWVVQRYLSIRRVQQHVRGHR